MAHLLARMIFLVFAVVHRAAAAASPEKLVDVHFTWEAGDAAAAVTTARSAIPSTFFLFLSAFFLFLSAFFLCTAGRAGSLHTPARRALLLDGPQDQR